MDTILRQPEIREFFTTQAWSRIYLVNRFNNNFFIISEHICIVKVPENHYKNEYSLREGKCA